MSKELKALIRIEDLLNMLYETDVIDDDHTHDINIIGKKLKRLEELEKAFKALSKDDEKTKELLSLEIEKNRTLEIIKEKAVNIYYVEITNNYINYNRCIDEFFGKYEHRDMFYLTQEEYDSVKKYSLN